MAKKDIVVVGASAGGMAALEQLVAGLPRGLPAALFVVWHLAPGVTSVLPMVRGGRAVGGARGGGGRRSRPPSGLDNVGGDHSLPGAQLGPVLAPGVREPGGREPLLAAREREKMEAELKIAREVDSRIEDILQYGELSPFTCPECHGVLATFRDGGITRFRCHTGHAVSAATLLEAGTEQVEQRLMDALRALDETNMLLNRLGEDYASKGKTAVAEQCFNRARDAY